MGGDFETVADDGFGNLVDAVLRCGFDKKCSRACHTMLALHFLISCLGLKDVNERLLPAVGRLMRTSTWIAIWDEANSVNTREAAAVLLLNASIVMRFAACRSEHGGILRAAIHALHRQPADDYVNCAAG